MAVAPLARGNLVRWRNGQTGNIGVVADLIQDGRQARVQFDSGEAMIFAWPSPTLERLVFVAGTQVESTADHQTGVVTGLALSGGVIVYQVALAGGAVKSVIETGLRPALVTDPVALLRSGELGQARSSNLRVTATRLLLAHQYDGLSSLSNSRVEIKEHQVGVLHRVAISYPHRFILADEVGLGKTVEAGLIIKELKARGVANRVLILTPPGIVSQWQYELRTKFNEVFSHFNKSSIAFLQAETPGENVWTLRDNVIASTTYAAWDERRQANIAMAGWDLIVIDEAHHARRTVETAGHYRSTKLYKLAESLADPEQGRSLGFLMLTATPMQLDPFELYSLIELLDPTLFADERDFEEHRSQLAGLNRTVDQVRRWDVLEPHELEAATEAIGTWLEEDGAHVATRLATAAGREAIRDELLAKHRLSDVLIRNRKATVGGFMPRVATVWPVNMTEQEWAAYQAITEYVRTGYARSRATRNNALGFLMAVFQKLSSSSSYALRQSLLRRIEKLEAGLPAPKGTLDPDEIDIEETPAEDALDEWLAMREVEDTRAEVAQLQGIVGLIDEIGQDTKTGVLLAQLAVLAKEEVNAKVLIFTQSRDTQEYLRQRIGSPWTVGVFHGQMDSTEKDAAVTAFREGKGAQLLISTEAGGEGRNFQFCHNLVNYDLPWNPMKIEQRIGRLDRIGQKRPVMIFNFSILGTIEERVLDVLTNRIRVFEETIGGLDPILGEVESDIQRVFLLADAEGKKALSNLDRQLDARVRDARSVERRLADLIMDTKSYRKDEVERLLGNRGTVDSDTLRRFTLTALTELGAAVDKHDEIDNAYQIRLRGGFENEFPHLAKDARLRTGTFDPAIAREHEELEFFAIGHEIVDALAARCMSREYGGRTSYRQIRTDDHAPESGWFFTFLLEFQGVVGSKEVVPVFVHRDGRQDDELAVWLLERAGRMKREDFAPAPAPVAALGGLDAAIDMANSIVIARLFERQAELETSNRERAAQEREKLERFYAYREIAAQEKLAAVRTTFQRLAASEDPEVQRILPVWRKKLENAERAVATVSEDRDRRLQQLAGRDVVTAQHESLTASFVEIVPDGRS
jgi:superfamily II DNA or RNA helicase